MWKEARSTRLSSLALIATFSLACSCASHRLPKPADCAAIGASIGALGGGAGAAAYAQDHSTGAAVGIGIAATVLGGGLGYAICALAPRDEPARPTVQTAAIPEPEPRAQPEPEPVYFEVCEVSVVLDGVRFDSGKATIRPDAAAVLHNLAKDLARCPDNRVRVEAHTDSSGSAGFNEALSQRRAEAVQSYLVHRGIAASRMTTVGLGERQPIADNGTPRGRAENRRVEIRPIEGPVDLDDVPRTQ